MKYPAPFLRVTVVGVWPVYIFSPALLVTVILASSGTLLNDKVWSYPCMIVAHPCIATTADRIVKDKSFFIESPEFKK